MELNSRNRELFELRDRRAFLIKRDADQTIFRLTLALFILIGMLIATVVCYF